MILEIQEFQVEFIGDMTQYFKATDSEGQDQDLTPSHDGGFLSPSYQGHEKDVWVLTTQPVYDRVSRNLPDLEPEKNIQLYISDFEYSPDETPYGAGNIEPLIKLLSL